MKLAYSKEWYESHIALEGDAEVGVGTPPWYRAKPLTKSYIRPGDTRIAFGTFVTLWRRNQGWDAVKLAETAGLDPEEVLEIEQDPNCEPESDAICKLAGVFGLSPKPLLELAGVIELGIPKLREKPVRFATRSESVAALSEREREAFEAFIATISETAKEDR